jgi:sugar-specific transcriptional regulator TrmB
MPKTNRKAQRSEEPLASPPALPSGRELEIGLTDLGLSEREARLYVAMLSKPDSTSTELYRMANISRPKVYEVLARMTERKLCIERQVGRVKRYTPVDPDMLVDTRTKQMTAQLSQIKKLRHGLSRLYAARDRTTVPLEYLEVLRTPRQVKERVQYIVEKSRNELLTFSKPPLTFRVEESNQITLRMLKRIKVVRTIYDFGVTLEPNWKEIRQYIARWHKAGEESRFIHKLPVKMFVCDGLHVLLVIQNAIGSGNEAPVLFSNRELGIAFRTVFESVWEEAIPFEEFMARHDEIAKEELLRHA